MTSPIPIGTAKRIADEYGYHQVVIIARSVGEDPDWAVITYGVDKANRDVAEGMGEFIKHDLLGRMD